jgi:hypothetical protein
MIPGAIVFLSFPPFAAVAELRRPPASCVVLALLAFALFHSGCSTTGQHNYRPTALPTEVKVDRSTAAAQKPSDPPAPVVATLHKVVIRQRAGPMGLNSYWDEYVLSIANNGALPATIDSTTLCDLHGKSVTPGDNPWTLANAHKSWLEQTDSHGVTSPGRIGAGSVLMGAFAPVFVAAGGYCYPVAVSPVSYAVSFGVVTPAYAANAISFNTRGRKEVEADFNGRRLVLPLTIAPGQAVEGSLFFPVTPGPQALAFHCQVADQATELTLLLTPLADLHLKK